MEAQAYCPSTGGREGEWMQEDQEVKAILGYLMILRSDWAT